ncbi:MULTISPECIES: hypothetical protein [unclassified Curtobacterium]|uniref:hypothetical protein n=1 Tax=unclassified Curtobacterium TaxID=257496 RepID=UPI0011B7CF1A|nr:MULTISPECIES: hypothetical protein [unclassified Curtobacterium]
MASHRMPESERPRRAVPAWVTAPPEDARPAEAAPAPASAGAVPGIGTVPAGTVPAASAVPAGTFPAASAVPAGTVPAVDLEAHHTTAPPVLDPNAVAPDYPPAQELLPPAPTSPNVDTIPFAPLSGAPVLGASAVGVGGSGVTVTTAAAGSPAVGRHGAGQRASSGRRDAAAAAGMALPVPPVAGTHAGGSRPAGAPPVAPEVQHPPLGPVVADPPRDPANWYTPQVGTLAAPEALSPSAGVDLATLGAPGPHADTTAWSASAPTTPPAPTVPVVPAAGQPRFSVPGLEHVVVEGGEPEPVGPIGYRTPARFARQQARVVPPAATAPPTFDALIGAPAPTTAVLGGPSAVVGAAAVPPLGPVLPSVTPTEAQAAVSSAEDPAPDDTAPPVEPTPAREHRNARGRGTTGRRPFHPRRTVEEPPKRRSTAVPLPAPAEVGTVATATPEGAASLPSVAQPAMARAGLSLGPTAGAVLGAVAGLGTIGLAAWWFTAPATVHAVGLVLGLLAVLVSVVTMRNPLTTWQRPVALLGAVLGTVGTLVLLWAVASALGAPLPDITGTGTVPAIAP